MVDPGILTSLQSAGSAQGVENLMLNSSPEVHSKAWLREQR